MTTYWRTATVRAAGEGRPIRAVLVTSHPAEDGYELSMAGARLDRFRANPVILWAHDYSELPIGRVTDLQVHHEHMDAELVFSTVNPRGVLVEQMIREGTLNGISVGFAVRKVDRDGRVDDWELLEVSAVPVPMDAAALVTSRTAHPAEAGRALLDAFDTFGARTLLDALDRG